MLGVLICFNDHQNFKISEKWRFQLQLDPSKIGPGFECFEQHPGLSGSIVQVSIQLDMNFGKLLLRPQMEGTCTLHLWSQEQFAKVHVELNAHLYYGAAEAWVLFKAFKAWADFGRIQLKLETPFFRNLKILMIIKTY